MLAQEMSLNFEEEVVVRLIGYHVGGPSISVGFPSFILPFYTTETNGSRRLTDMLKVCAGCFRREVSSCGAWVRVEPFLHVDLELVLGLLVFKDVGHLSGAPVVRGGRFVELLGGPPLGSGRSSRIGGGCLIWWQGSELDADPGVGAWWGLGR